MRAAPSGRPGTPVIAGRGRRGGDDEFDNEGLLRLDAAASRRLPPLLAEVNATLARELERAAAGAGSPDAFGNVYCKGNRYDLKLPWGRRGKGVAGKRAEHASVSRKRRGAEGAPVRVRRWCPTRGRRGSPCTRTRTTAGTGAW